MNRNQPIARPVRQRGAVLLVAVVLLLLAGIMSLLALNVGMFEQRSTGNDLRAKLVNEVAEAGLGQGFEYLMRQNAAMLDDNALWEKCLDTDETFPCGAVTQYEPDGTTQRRSTMYRLKAATNNIPNIATELSQYMLPMPASSKVSSIGNGEVAAYGVAPVLCRVISAPDLPPPAPPTPIRCGDGTGATATDLRIATFVSIAAIPGEAARTTLVQTIGSYPLLGNLLGKPPLTASGSANIAGGLQVVTNPNAAGPGVPVSVWTRLNLEKHGSPNTCYADEFFRYTQGSVTPVPYQGTIQCDDCQCDVNGSPKTLSYDQSGANRCDGSAGFTDCEGIDILDVEDGTNSTTGYNTAGHEGANYNVRSDSLSYPICEFPPDLFQFTFGVAAWRDETDPQDCFAEVKIMADYANPNTGQLVNMGADEKYLYTNAATVMPTEATTLANLLAPTQIPGVLNPVALGPTSSGMIWCQTDCDIGVGTQVGTPSAPVILILDGPVDIKGTIYGLVFIRDTESTLNPVTGGGISLGTCPSDCILRMESSAAVYGAMVLQGQMKITGTPALIHDATVLGNLNGTGNIKYATLPGAWNDQQSY